MTGFLWFTITVIALAFAARAVGGKAHFLVIPLLLLAAVTSSFVIWP